VKVTERRRQLRINKTIGFYWKTCASLSNSLRAADNCSVVHQLYLNPCNEVRQTYAVQTDTLSCTDLSVSLIYTALRYHCTVGRGEPVAAHGTDIRDSTFCSTLCGGLSFNIGPTTISIHLLYFNNCQALNENLVHFQVNNSFLYCTNTQTHTQFKWLLFG